MKPMKINLAKTLAVIKNNMFLRILSILNIVFIIFISGFLIASLSFKNNVVENISEIETHKQTLESLELIAQQELNGELDAASDILEKKSFAKYEEVIPFIAILESLFSTIDPKAEITIKSKESQIYIDHYADYQINLEVGEEKKVLFLKAFDELYNSRFITMIRNFSVIYKASEANDKNEFAEAEFIIRLYLD